MEGWLAAHRYFRNLLYFSYTHNAVKMCKMRTNKKGACELPKIAQGTASKDKKVVDVM